MPSIKLYRLESRLLQFAKEYEYRRLTQRVAKGGTDEPQEPVLATLTIPEGYTLDQIAQTVGQLQGDFKESLTAEAFLAKVQDETFISQAVAKYPTLLESLPVKTAVRVIVWKDTFSQLHTLSRKAQLLRA